VTAQSDKKYLIKYGFIDDGLYRVFPDSKYEKGSYTLDIIEFIINLNRDIIMEEKQILNTASRKDRVVITPRTNTVSLSLIKNKTEIVIDKSLCYRKR